METKRCAHCQKLSRGDAEVCRRCGHPFGERVNTNKISVRTGHFASRSGGPRSIPPASPHKAGHYSGLHPEDQPYQSAFLPAQHPPHSRTLSRPLHPVPREPDVIVLAGVEPPPEAPPDPDSLDVPDFPTQHVAPVERKPVQRIAPPTPLPALPVQFDRPERKYKRHRQRFIPVALTISVLCLLIAGSIFTFLLLNRHTYHPQLNSTPVSLRDNDTLLLSGSDFGANDQITFTHDDSQTPMLNGNGLQLAARSTILGAFSVSIVIPSNWLPGQHTLHANDAVQGVGATTTITIQQPSSAPPRMALATRALDMGAAGPGVVSNKTITLTNAGGSQLNWQASSDAPWLTVSPNGGSFSGSSAVHITVNRGALPSLSYTGHVLFRQSTPSGGGNKPFILTVHMVVTAAPASLTVSSVALTYSGSTTQNPAAQTLTLQNSDIRPVDWSSATVTGDGAPWLTISPSNGHLNPKSTQTITVSAQSQQLAPGTYQGTIIFKGGANPQVTVSLAVVTPGNLTGNLIISPPSLNFAAVGQNPPAQSVTLQNSGGEPLNWSVSATTTGGGNWLGIAPASGTLSLNTSAAVAVTVNATTLKPASYQGLLTFSSGRATKQVAVSLTVSVPPEPAIRLNASTLNFSTIKGNDPNPQTFAITNTGNATLNWAIAEDTNGSTYAPVSPSSGSLAPNASATITVAPTVQQANGGTILANITVKDSDGNPKVPAQSVAVSILVQDIPVLSLSTNSITFNHNSNITDSFQWVTLYNTGSQPLDWQIQPSSPDTSWLTLSNPTGTVDSGSSMVADIECDSSTLSPGTYTAELVVSDTDANTPVPSQTIVVTLYVN